MISHARAGSREDLMNVTSGYPEMARDLFGRKIGLRYIFFDKVDTLQVERRSCSAWLVPVCDAGGNGA